MIQRRLLYLIFVLSWLWSVIPVRAQETSPDLALLAIELWPDYDQEGVLVLYTGTLAAEAVLPAVVTLPLLEGADVHAVARISSDNTMVDDIVFEVGASEVTLTTPDSRFRVEYYLPYEADGEEHSFAAAWTFPFNIASVTIDAQQPAAATNFTITPTAPNVVTGQDGLTYHRSTAQPLEAGQVLSVEIRYTLPGNQLTQSLLQQNTGVTTPETTTTTELTATTPASSNLPLILAGIGGLIISGTLIWQGLKERSQQQQKKKELVRRQSPRSSPVLSKRRAAPTPPATGEAAQFCHQCGRAAQPEDRFCRQCGTQLKGR